MNKRILNLVDSLLIPHSKFTEAIADIEQYIAAHEQYSSPMVIPLIGQSRTGKTSVLSHIQQRYPRKRLEEGMFIPVLYVKTPSKPTVKGLAEQMLVSLGDPRSGIRDSEIQKTQRILKLIRGCGTKLIALDEFQHFYDQTTHKVIHHASDWLKNLAEDSGAMTLLSGIESSLNVIYQNEQLAGRCVAEIEMPRFDWEIDHQRNEFIGILKAFEAGLAPSFEIPDLSDPELAFRFYVASGGLIGYLAKIFKSATWVAMSKRSSWIGLEELAVSVDKVILKQGNNIPNPFNKETFSLDKPLLLAQAKTVGVNSLNLGTSLVASRSKRRI